MIVPNRAAFVTADAETRVVAPAGLQVGREGDEGESGDEKRDSYFFSFLHFHSTPIPPLCVGRHRRGCEQGARGEFVVLFLQYFCFLLLRFLF